MKKLLIIHFIGIVIELYLIIHYVNPETGTATTITLCILFFTQRLQWVNSEMKKINEKILSETLNLFKS